MSDIIANLKHKYNIPNSLEVIIENPRSKKLPQEFMRFLLSVRTKNLLTTIQTKLYTHSYKDKKPTNISSLSFLLENLNKNLSKDKLPAFLINNDTTSPSPSLQIMLKQGQELFVFDITPNIPLLNFTRFKGETKNKSFYSKAFWKHKDWSKIRDQSSIKIKLPTSNKNKSLKSGV